jgi:hypothetical protein
MANQGYYGGTYDRYVSSNSEPSTISKMKETYWTTKQAVMTKLGKKQDEHIVASDAELDAKLELFRSIEQSCFELLRVIEKYQDRLCVLSREENAMGRMLKVSSENDKTRAGKMMAAVGKAQNFSSQQLLQLRAPLVRLYQEVEVFRHRAVSDTLLTVERMEAARTEYRGALLWMKDVSEVLDPDTSKQLQKFRMVQAQVKKTKAKFDRLKLDTMQKIDLLAASRSNMFSQVLVKYQSTLLSFWEKMSYRMTAVADSFKGYQYYEFNMLKELGEPSKKLAEETGATDRHDTALDDSLDDARPISGVLPRLQPIPKAPGTLLPCLQESSSSAEAVPPPSAKPAVHASAQSTPTPSAAKPTSTEATPIPSEATPSAAVDSSVPLIDMYSDEDALNEFLNSSACGGPRLDQLVEQKRKLDRQSGGWKANSGSLNNLLDTSGASLEGGAKSEAGGCIGSAPFIEFDEDDDVDIDELKRKQDEEFDFGSILKMSSADKKLNKNTAQGPIDLLSSDLGSCDFDMDKDDVTLLNEILNTPAGPAAGSGEFTNEWQAAFGTTLMPLSSAAAGTLTASSDAADSSKVSDFFMPSSLLDMTSGGPTVQPTPVNIPLIPPPRPPTSLPMGPLRTQPGAVGGGGANSQTGPQQKPKKKADQKAEMSAWFNLFAELDPLSNPDAIGRNKDDLTDA